MRNLHIVFPNIICNMMNTTSYTMLSLLKFYCYSTSTLLQCRFSSFFFSFYANLSRIVFFLILACIKKKGKFLYQTRQENEKQFHLFYVYITLGQRPKLLYTQKCADKHTHTHIAWSKGQQKNRTPFSHHNIHENLNTFLVTLYEVLSIGCPLFLFHVYNTFSWQQRSKFLSKK